MRTTVRTLGMVDAPSERHQQEAKETVERYFEREAVPADAEPEVRTLYEDGRYLLALKVLASHWRADE